MGLGYNVTANQLAQDYLNLSSVVKKEPKQVQGNVLIGPSTIPLVQLRVIEFFANYYLDGRHATLGDFVSPSVLDSLEAQLKTANKIAEKYTPGKKVWMGETSSAWGGGAKNISSSFGAAFMWLDKLGLAAKHNFGGIMRQAFIQGSYALVDPNTCNPNPDYWLTVLYKKLVGSAVFPVFVDDFTKKIRLYAHCAHTKWYVPDQCS
ncbi:hypothetical protein FSP39_004641 [Pinctada imbricata]|uniref:Uncharacterized protein n=1 Tax=Pinctada imbricata TaxID=66713 RepID=A0AA88Y2E7_PINIB|nr:hypothetical protein FSP39_004641 [Pinctada imbricata]